MLSNLPQENPLMRDNDSYAASKNLADNTPPQLIIPKQAESDEQLIGLWIHGRSVYTQKAYRRDINLFQNHTQKRLNQIKLQDLQDFADYLFQKQQAPASIRRTLAAVKSLFSFAHRIGYLQFDIGEPLRLPACKDNLSQRILSEEEVQKIIFSITNERNRLIVETLYVAGIRISELTALKWIDLQPRTEGGQMTIFGKGGKTNNILIPDYLWNKLMMLRSTIDDNQPVFRSKKGGHINCGQVQKILRTISLKAIGKPASPHYYRHSHASHSLDHGCPIHILQKQLNHSSIATTGKYLHARPTESSSKYLKIK